MLIRLEQINVTVGDIRGNRDAILNALKKAEEERVDLLILPELVLCGYPPMDLLERKAFLKEVYHETAFIVENTRQTGLLFGTVCPTFKKSGKPLYNAAMLACQGEVVDVIHKALLPSYDVFDECRYFEPNRDLHITNWNGRKWGITVCEDIWNHQNEYPGHTYDIDPPSVLKNQGAEILINISASPFTQKKPESRERMLRGHARNLHLPLLFINQPGANTELIFDGTSTAINSAGKTVCRLPAFMESRGDVEWNGPALLASPNNESPIQPFPGYEERIFKALVMGLRDYVNKSNVMKGVILGLSGGIDSALTAVIAVEALGPERVTGVTMPSPYSSPESVADSEKLAANLGIHLEKIQIDAIYDAFLSPLNTLFGEAPIGVMEENIQSRIRGTILMAFSNKKQVMLLNTGNKSELAAGYCTLYGDMAGGLSILSDLYKTEVYDVSKWLNNTYFKKEIIPRNTIFKPPSAELRPNQKDTDTLPEYDVLDKILMLYIEEQLPADEIIKKGLPEAEVRKIIQLADQNEYKRRQAAPGLRISPKAFGIGRRLPIVQQWSEPLPKKL